MVLKLKKKRDGWKKNWSVGLSPNSIKNHKNAKEYTAMYPSIEIIISLGLSVRENVFAVSNRWELLWMGTDEYIAMTAV